jgi:hypothetical protein
MRNVEGLLARKPCYRLRRHLATLRRHLTNQPLRHSKPVN